MENQTVLLSHYGVKLVYVIQSQFYEDENKRL